MKPFTFTIVALFSYTAVIAQHDQSVIRGKVMDAKTKSPLSRATIKAGDLESVTDAKGEFKIPYSSDGIDSLSISHLGYKTYKKHLADLSSPAIILLEDYSIELRTITITSRRLNLKHVDSSLRKIKGNLYAYETEITNGLYNLFLNFLEEQDQKELVELCSYDLSRYDEAARKFYEEYIAPFKVSTNEKDTSRKNYTEFPVVNISHDAAVLFCQWFTEQYNSSPGKKKFIKVRFRLPTSREWQIAALGYPKFQSWNLDENTVPIVIPNDTISEIKKGKKTNIPVEDIQYPWWNHYNYRKRVLNARNCYLGNFKSVRQNTPCPLGNLPGFDGWTKMAQTSSYFPNDMGLYDIVGNVAEMIDEKGKAYGGSWNDSPSDATIRSVKSYNGPSDTIGFRVFMEVIE